MQSRLAGLENGMDSLTLAVRAKARKPKSLASKLLIVISLFIVISIVLSVVNISSIRNFGFLSNSFYDESDFLGLWIRPPEHLLHQMSDKELFWRASFAPRIKEYPFVRVKKIAFMFLTKGPLPLARLWERFFKGHEGLYSIYIHSMPSYDPKFSSSSVFFKRQIPSQVVQWGKMSVVDAERRLLANALLDISNERFILLSETCIPIVNFTVIYSHIMKSNLAFLSSFDDPGPFGRGRYNYQMAPLVDISQWRKGGQWFEVDRDLALTLIEDDEYYPVFRDSCRPPCYVDEHYFPTLLTIKAADRIANRSLTWVDWSRGGYHPATFGGADITAELFAKVNREDRSCGYNNISISMCFLFARKFAPNSLKPLLSISSSVFGY